MPELAIQQELWDDFRVVAERQKKRPEALAVQVLREYIRRWGDEELLTRSAEFGRKSSFAVKETEEIIRRYRQRKKR